MSAARLHEAIRLFLADRFFRLGYSEKPFGNWYGAKFRLKSTGIGRNPQMEPDERRLKTASNRVAAVPMSSRFMP
ncbi:MAG TPA: hypothetical protein VIS71_04735, partial [Terrimicrobium sp.]